MSYKPLDDRQVINRAALANIGSPANDSLDNIFSLIDAILASVTAGNEYVAKRVALTNGSTSYVATISAQPDTSYIVLGLMSNTVDAFPQYQQVQVTNKTTSGFTLSWNHPLDSANYFLSYIVPLKAFPEVEASIGSGLNTLSSPLFVPQPYAGYPVISELQNLVDANPQFQNVVIRTNSTSAVNLSWNVNTDSANYVASYMINATGQSTVSNGATSVTVPLPVGFGGANYAVVASMQNTVDSHPQFQPMIVTAEGANSVTFSWNVAKDSGNYLINYYAISLTH